MLPIWTITPRNSFIQVYPYLRDVTTKIFPQILQIFSTFFSLAFDEDLLEDRMGYPLKSSIEPPKKGLKNDKWCPS